MTIETLESIGLISAALTPLFVLVSRILSHFEHKKTNKDVTEIKLYINGELAKKLEEAKEEGRQEEIKKQQK